MEGLNIPLNHILLVSTLLFSIGMLGLMIRRNIIFILMSLEVMLNAAALAFVAAGFACFGFASGFACLCFGAGLCCCWSPLGAARRADHLYVDFNRGCGRSCGGPRACIAGSAAL